jgi:hypothetical protein
MCAETLPTGADAIDRQIAEFDDTRGWRKDEVCHRFASNNRGGYARGRVYFLAVHVGMQLVLVHAFTITMVQFNDLVGRCKAQIKQDP